MTRRIEGADLRHTRIDSIDALIEAAGVTRDVYRFMGKAAPIVRVLLTRRQFDETRGRLERQIPFGDWEPRNGVIRWNNMDLTCEKPHATLVNGRWEATPASPEVEDLAAALIAEKRLNGLEPGEIWAAA